MNKKQKHRSLTKQANWTRIQQRKKQTNERLKTRNERQSSTIKNKSGKRSKMK